VEFPETSRTEGRITALAQRAPGELRRPWSGRLRRGKVRRPDLPALALPRPRLMARIDEGDRPLTLIVAPAGFGKTTAAVEWANQEPRAVWLTADAADASLPRFWAHLRAALADMDPGFGELVTTSFDAALRASAADLGRLFADELLDTEAPVRLVIDDFHLVPEGETHAFLSGLFEIAPPGFRLVITARSEPPLPLPRLRLRGVMNELRGNDLLFTAEETRALIADTRSRYADRVIDRDVEALWQRTRGWAAGVHLAAIAGSGSAAAALEPGGEADARLLSALLDETLAGRSPSEQSALVRAALPERFEASLVAALGDRGDGLTTARSAIRFALAADLCRPAQLAGGEWCEYHPLFREALLGRLQREETPETLAILHARAATWFENAERPDAAIVHRLGAGELALAIALVEREIQPAFDREDWPAVARWLTLLPDETVHEHLPLLLATGWLAHLRGQVTRLKEIVRAIDERLARGDLPPAEREAVRVELDLMVLCSLLPIQIDPERALGTAREAIDRVPPAQRFQYGLAWTVYGMALQATGRGDEAVERLAWWAGEASDRLDAGSMRGRFSLLFVHWQAASLARVQSMARTTHEVASRHRLRLATCWGHYFLGNVLYERNDLDGAVAQFGAVARHYEYFHLSGLREAYFGLALAFVAAGRTAEGWRALRRVRDILLDAGALEHLPVLDAEEAYLALRVGDLPRALAWAQANLVGVDSASLYYMGYPAVIRAAILCAAGDAGSLDEATALLAEVRQRAAGAHYLGPLVRIDALTAIAHVKRGEWDEGVAAMRRSLATGVPQGYTRTYLDLLPVFGEELAALAASLELPSALRAALDSPPGMAPSDQPSVHTLVLIETLTRRERDVLAALLQRLSYREIAERLFISPATVKHHASSVYSKLGVTGRNETIRVAREHGWHP
jgi:LuxR family transcriptional regulator, maltose regulon positive regulatory protein